MFRRLLIACAVALLGVTQVACSNVERAGSLRNGLQIEAAGVDPGTNAVTAYRVTWQPNVDAEGRPTGPFVSEVGVLDGPSISHTTVAGLAAVVGAGVSAVGNYAAAGRLRCRGDNCGGSGSSVYIEGDNVRADSGSFSGSDATANANLRANSGGPQRRRIGY